MKRFTSALLILLLTFSFFDFSAGAVDFTEEISAKSCILVDSATGKVLFEYNTLALHETVHHLLPYKSVQVYFLQKPKLHQ